MSEETRLPDDIEQKLIDGQRLRATHDLAERRGIPLHDAKILVGRWLFGLASKTDPESPAPPSSNIGISKSSPPPCPK
jgi:hypothetical protein